MSPRKHSHRQQLGRDAAVAVLAGTTLRPVRLIFRSVAIVWHQERDIICRTPAFCLKSFGSGLGMEEKEVRYIIHETLYYVEKLGRITTGGASTVKPHRVADYVLEDGRRVTR